MRFFMAKVTAVLGSPKGEIRKVTPRRLKNRSYRDREHLEPKEVDRLQEAARSHSRYGHRDATAVLIAYRHGLRASELCDLTWDLINLDKGTILVRRAKGGIDSKHPLTGKEIRDLRKLRRENPETGLNRTTRHAAVRSIRCGRFPRWRAMLLFCF
jgi:integrase